MPEKLVWKSEAPIAAGASRPEAIAVLCEQLAALRMTTRPRSQEFPGTFAHEHAYTPAALTIRQWRRIAV